MVQSQLEESLDLARKDVKTESYSMSIGELTNMYENDEIVLRPEYQRYFRWKSEQKSKLIESILIGLPLPSFFMAQDEDGKWEVVDGMQRLSTIFDFVNILKTEHVEQDSYQKFERLDDDLFYLSEFKNKSWNDFTPRIKLDFKRTKVQLIILMRETNTDAKFELFQRLNSGGTSISGQELRNAILAKDKPELLRFLEDLAETESFVSTTSLAESEKAARYDMELVLRFLVFMSDYGNNLGKFNSLDVFLTHSLREMIKDNFEFHSLSELFKNTFDIIHNTAGPRALNYKTSPGTGKFSISFFEAVVLGIAQNIDNLPNQDVLLEKVNSIGNLSEYKSASGTGKNVKTRIPTLKALGKKYFCRDTTAE